jgi:hypothetical protein
MTRKSLSVEVKEFTDGIIRDLELTHNDSSEIANKKACADPDMHAIKTMRKTIDDIAKIFS